MLAVGVQISLLLNQGEGVRIEIPRGTRIGGRANLINLLIYSIIYVTRNST